MKTNLSFLFYSCAFGLLFGLQACITDPNEDATPARKFTRNTQSFTVTDVKKSSFSKRTFFEFSNKNGSFDVKHTLWTYKNGNQIEGILTPKSYPATLDCDSIKLVYTLTDGGTQRETEVMGRAGESMLMTTKDGKTTLKFDLKTNNDKMVGEIGE